MSESIIATIRGYIPDRDMPFFTSKDIYESDGWESKDWNFERIRRSLIHSWEIDQEHVIEEFTPISNQGSAGTCVANAWCDAVEILLGLNYGRSNVQQLSRRFAYWISRYLHSATDKEEGTYLRAMGRQFRKVGVVLEAVMPYSDQIEDLVGKKASPKLEHYSMASNNRIESFYRLSEQSDQMLREAEVAIRSDHPVLIGVPVDRSFTSMRGMHVFDAPTNPIGKHAMIATGVRFVDGSRQWLLRNSWGAHWGENGHCWITDDYMSLSGDTWIGTLMEDLI